MGREHWQSGEENKARGMAWLDQIYKQDRKGTINKFEAHRDFGKPIPNSSLSPVYQDFIACEHGWFIGFSRLDLRQHNLRPLFV